MTDKDQLLADVLTALLTYQHQFPPDLVGRVLMAVGPSMLAAAPPVDPSYCYAAHPSQPAAYEGITTGPGSWA